MNDLVLWTRVSLFVVCSQINVLSKLTTMFATYLLFANNFNFLSKSNVVQQIPFSFLSLPCSPNLDIPIGSCRDQLFFLWM